MKRLYKTNGIIIRKTNLSDHHKIATIFTENEGKVKAVVRGVKKIKSKMAAHVELGNLSYCIIARGKKDLDTLTSAKSIEQFKNISLDLEKASTLYYICELTDRITPDQHIDPALFEMLVHTLSVLNQEDDSEKIQLIKDAFTIQLLKLTGYMPETRNCVSCAEKIKEELNFFSVEKGGVVCPSCKETSHIKTHPEKIKILRFFEKAEMKHIRLLKSSSYKSHNIHHTLSQYVQYILAKPIKSQYLIEKIKRI